MLLVTWKILSHPEKFQFIWCLFSFFMSFSQCSWFCCISDFTGHNRQSLENVMKWKLTSLLLYWATHHWLDSFPFDVWNFMQQITLCKLFLQLIIVCLFGQISVIVLLIVTSCSAVWACYVMQYVCLYAKAFNNMHHLLSPLLLVSFMRVRVVSRICQPYFIGVFNLTLWVSPSVGFWTLVNADFF